MMKTLLLVTTIAFATAAAPAARAQVTLDVSKITCEQFVGYKITNPQNIALWLSGYYNGKRGNTVIDTQALTDNAAKLRSYCILNGQTPVMTAVETLLGGNK
jgi:acid stress chaperone HdeB